MSVTASLAAEPPQRQQHSRAAVGLLPLRSVSRQIVCKSGELKLCAFCVVYVIFSLWIVGAGIHSAQLLQCPAFQAALSYVSFSKGTHQPFEPLVDLSEVMGLVGTAWVLSF